jgi:hypothetical protein
LSDAFVASPLSLASSGVPALDNVLAGKEYFIEAGEVLQIPSSVEHGVVALEDSVALDVLSPIRDDWLSGDDGYLRGENYRKTKTQIVSKKSSRMTCGEKAKRRRFPPSHS